MGWKVTFARIAVFIPIWIVLKSQGAETWEATAFGLIFAQLVFPNRSLT